MRIALLLLSAFVIGCSQPNGKGDLTTTESVEYTIYGEEVEMSEEVSLQNALTQLENQDSLIITTKGEISSTCAMKGCWMKVKMPDGSDMRVTFKDYGFFVPKGGVEGKEAVFNGYIKKTVIDEETRKHYAKDAGQTKEEIEAITGDEEQITFVAEGVAIYE